MVDTRSVSKHHGAKQHASKWHHFAHALKEGARHYLHHKLAVEHRKRHGHSKTHQSRSSEKIKGDDVHSGITSKSYLVHTGLKFPKSYVKGPGIYVDEVYGSYSTSPPGQQMVTVFAESGTFSQAYALDLATTSLATSYPFWLGPIRYLDLIPTTLMQNPQYFSTTTQVSEEKICQRSCNITVELLNDTTTCSSVDVYLLMAKKDIVRPAVAGTTPQTFSERNAFGNWISMNNLEGNRGPQTFRAGAGLPAVGTEAINHPMAIPEENKVFNEWYATLVKHHINMAPAATETVTFDVVQNKVWDYAKDVFKMQYPGFVDNSSQGNLVDNQIRLQLAKHGVCVMVIARGAPVFDTVGSTVNIAPQKILAVISKKTHFSLMKANSKKFSTIQALDNMAIDTATSSLKQVDAVDSIISPLQG